ncbi:hydrolase [Bacteroidia bacterium]|nr:hydrolase [Bacteroidia bacterium]
MAYLRKDGRKGIRNRLLVVYTVECASFVAKRIVEKAANPGVQLIGSGGCAPNEYISAMMQQLCTHPNVGGVVVVALGCENLDFKGLAETVRHSGRPAENVVIQEIGGTSKAIEQGLKLVQSISSEMEKTPLCNISPNELIIGTICGGSDGYSGITSNPAIGMYFDRFIAQGGAGIFEEGGELVGCIEQMAGRAVSDEVKQQIKYALHKTIAYYEEMGNESFSLGNAEGGLTTIIEKSLGAYCKSGQSVISGVIQPGEIPQKPGLYFLDVIPDGEVKWGFSNVSDNAEIAELIACGAHLILFSTGRGSVAGSAISPVVKICSNSMIYNRLLDDMDINAGKILDGQAQLSGIADEIEQVVQSILENQPTQSENLGHAEFFLGYKYFNSPCKNS